MEAYELGQEMKASGYQSYLIQWSIVHQTQRLVAGSLHIV